MMVMLANYTFLTLNIPIGQPNVYAGRKEQILDGFSNASPTEELMELNREVETCG